MLTDDVIYDIMIKNNNIIIKNITNRITSDDERGRMKAGKRQRRQQNSMVTKNYK